MDPHGAPRALEGSRRSARPARSFLHTSRPFRMRFRTKSDGTYERSEVMFFVISFVPPLLSTDAGLLGMVDFGSVMYGKRPLKHVHLGLPPKSSSSMCFGFGGGGNPPQQQPLTLRGVKPPQQQVQEWVCGWELHKQGGRPQRIFPATGPQSQRAQG